MNLLVTEAFEESTILEFKRQLPDPGKNDDLVRDIAAMANTDGGTMIFGIEEDENGRARRLVPFELAQAVERVSQIARRMDEPLTVDVFAIADPDQEGKGFLVLVVPRSERAPHLFNGLALGRASKNNYALTRRQLGQLYARSKGFAEEFGLSHSRPGRLKAVSSKEFNPRGNTWSYFLMFHNDGEAEIYGASWDWAEETTGIIIRNNVQSLGSFPPGGEFRVNVSLQSSRVGGGAVITRWSDELGVQQTSTWPTSW
jgi:hypothetical protein